MAAQKPIRIVFFQRKQRHVGNFSVEIYFDLIRTHLPRPFEPILVTMPYLSTGLFKRIANTFFCYFKQGDINHVTGDIQYVASVMRKRKTISTVLDCGMLKNVGQLKYSIFKYFWYTLPARHSNYFSVISSATKTDLLNYISFPEDKIKVIYISVSAAFYRSEKAFNKKKPAILQIGTAENKNLKRLIPAIAGLNCRLVIIGKISEDISQLLQRNGIEFENIDKAISEQEIIRHYHESDIVSLVSTLEGFGMPIVEANITGRVVITGNVASMPEVAGNAAHLVDPFDIDAIRNGFLRIIGDDAYRDQLIMNGYENAKRFQLSKIVDDHVNLYTKCLAS